MGQNRLLGLTDFRATCTLHWHQFIGHWESDERLLLGRRGVERTQNLDLGATTRFQEGFSSYNNHPECR